MTWRASWSSAGGSRACTSPVDFLNLLRTWRWCLWSLRITTSSCWASPWPLGGCWIFKSSSSRCPPSVGLDILNSAPPPSLRKKTSRAYAGRARGAGLRRLYSACARRGQARLCELLDAKRRTGAVQQGRLGKGRQVRRQHLHPSHGLPGAGIRHQEQVPREGGFRPRRIRLARLRLSARRLDVKGAGNRRRGVQRPARVAEGRAPRVRPRRQGASAGRESGSCANHLRDRHRARIPHRRLLAHQARPPADRLGRPLASHNRGAGRCKRNPQGLCGGGGKSMGREG